MARRPGCRSRLWPPAAASFLFVVLATLPAGPTAAFEIAGTVILPKVSTPASQASLGMPGLVGGAESPAVRGAEPVIVYIAQAAGELPHTPTPNARVRLSRGRALPALVPVSLGSAIAFENDDQRGHHLVCRRGALRRDLGALKRGERREVAFEEPGNLRFECAQHGDVVVEVVVFAHAAFALVDAKGTYRLPDLPLGHATVVAYSPRLGEVSREVEVTASGLGPVDFTF
jgi:plastocyanin